MDKRPHIVIEVTWRLFRCYEGSCSDLLPVPEGTSREYTRSANWLWIELNWYRAILKLNFIWPCYDLSVNLNLSPNFCPDLNLALNYWQPRTYKILSCNFMLHGFSDAGINERRLSKQLLAKTSRSNRQTSSPGSKRIHPNFVRADVQVSFLFRIQIISSSNSFVLV